MFIVLIVLYMRAQNVNRNTRYAVQLFSALVSLYFLSL